ncbi:DUF2945 domain-containing protein [Streptomyces sp. HMX87]|uniref:DUF2945 domain-containing protein n=1 Tax=Streptomyces sp. HMX87 TaxID=3390849 RepID=UPI003A8B38AE
MRSLAVRRGVEQDGRHGSETEGKDEKKITERTRARRAAGRTVDASSEEPQYEVRGDRSGKSAVHKPSALRKKK